MTRSLSILCRYVYYTFPIVGKHYHLEYNGTQKISNMELRCIIKVILVVLHVITTPQPHGNIHTFPGSGLSRITTTKTQTSKTELCMNAPDVICIYDVYAAVRYASLYVCNITLPRTWYYVNNVFSNYTMCGCVYFRIVVNVYILKKM